MAMQITKKVTTKTTVKTTSTVGGVPVTTGSSSRTVNVSSSKRSFLDDFGSGLGIDLTKSMDEEIERMKREMFNMKALEPAGSSNQVVKLDSNSLMKFMDKDHQDKLRFNFDVHEFSSESVNVKTVGNTIEVHGTKTVKKGGEEQSESYSRSYELPCPNVDPNKVTSSIFKDGVLTVELPVSEVEK
nr:small heat shock protein [Sipunculus nudus]